MKKQTTIALLMVLLCGFTIHCKSQVAAVTSPTVEMSPTSELNLNGQKKGTFYVSPFYEFTNFTNLKLTEHTNTYWLPEGEFTEDFTQELIDSYNETYGTEYQSSTAGIRLSYMLMDGMGINAFAGVSHFDSRSWIAEGHTQYLSSQSPAFSMGASLEYQKAVYKKLSVASILSYNHVVTSTPHVNIHLSEDITSSSLTSMYWEFDLAIGYDLGRFKPYAGGGYTQQFIHSDYTEEFIAYDNAGNEYYDISNYDSHFSGASFFGFAGLEYRLNTRASTYIRSSFINPLRANIGFKIVL